VPCRGQPKSDPVPQSGVGGQAVYEQERPAGAVKAAKGEAGTARQRKLLIPGA